ncbi:MAG: SGNH/GDSL hydrolase family protein [Cyanobacteriota bacterium]|nr:SGNH/GDSL hydrolase family protein [Cyanobacteriota bacterium]
MLPPEKPGFVFNLILALSALISLSCSSIKLDSESDKISDKPLENVTASKQSEVTVMPEKAPTKIMPLGDSITDGYDFPGGYRINLWKQLSDRGYKINFVGSLINGPNYLPDRDHEGHSGWRIDQINEYINIWLKRTQPDIILLTIGTNDIAQNYRVKTAPERLNNLIDEIFQEVPNADILVASIPPIEMEELDRRVNEYNRAIAALVERRQKEGDRLIFVDINSALNFDDLEDSVHPNSRGHSKMATVWEEALIPLFENR